MKLQITFPGNKKVAASFDGFTVTTDQPKDNEGDGSAPAPFDLFLASIGTCAGYFVKSFCEERKIEIEGLTLTEEAVWDEETHKLKSINLMIHLPQGFPDKYKNAVISAANLCSVKKTLLNPPEFTIKAETQAQRT